MKGESAMNFQTSESPMFSIILPTYNRRRLLAMAVSSVRAQTFEDWELLIIDDGSSDSSLEVVVADVLDDRRIRYHFAANRGLPAARNLGLAMGTGRYFTFLDSDDEYLPEHLAIRANYLRAHHETELLHGGMEVIGSEMVADKNDPSKQIPLSECVVGGTFFIRRDLAERLQGFREIAYGDDADLFERAQLSGAVIHTLHNPTYRYNRLEPDSLTRLASEHSGILLATKKEIS